MLNTWINKGGSLPARLNGIGFPQDITAEINSAHQPEIFDISRRSSTLYLPDSQHQQNEKKQRVVGKTGKKLIKRFTINANYLVSISHVYSLRTIGLLQ